MYVDIAKSWKCLSDELVDEQTHSLCWVLLHCARLDVFVADTSADMFCNLKTKYLHHFFVRVQFHFRRLVEYEYGVSFSKERESEREVTDRKRTGSAYAPRSTGTRQPKACAMQPFPLRADEQIISGVVYFLLLLAVARHDGYDKQFRNARLTNSRFARGGL